MKTSVLIRLGTVLLVLAVIGITVVGQVKAQADQAKLLAAVKDTTASLAGQVMSKSMTKDQEQAALAQWTHADIAKVKPLQIPVDTSNPSGIIPASNDTEALGTPGFFAPGAASPDAQKAYLDISKMTTRAVPADKPAAVNGTKQVYTAYAINWFPYVQVIPPHQWVGILFFDTPSGAAACSATALSGNTIVTAAHCVYDTTYNLWYSDWTFLPGYSYGSAYGDYPYGMFPAYNCWILTSWANLKGNYKIASWTKYDVAVCQMDTNGSDTLNDMVGWAGWAYNGGYTQSVFDMGYPWRDYMNNDLPYGGEFLRTCTAETFKYATDVMGAGCYYGAGISGGPWMLGYAQGDGSTGWVDSVNSGLILGKQNLYGIRFTSKNIYPLCIVAGCD